MKQFNLTEISYEDLDGRKVTIEFDKKDFGNFLFTNAPSLEFDGFAREIHKDGKADITEEITAQLQAVLSQRSPYTFRVNQAINDYLLTLKID